ncbi:uncharacterized protein TNCV_5031061 [Trichonephila clavipes]|nr:uncharacterized protein TNCV_5031061 [Trichonephila clavipes]
MKILIHQLNSAQAQCFLVDNSYVVVTPNDVVAKMVPFVAVKLKNVVQLNCRLCPGGTGFESRRRKCIVPLRHGGTLNSRRAASPIKTLLEGEERWVAPDHPQGVLPQNWDKTDLKRSVTCMVLKAAANDRRHLALCHDEIRGP